MNKKLISMAVGAALTAGTVVAQAADEATAPTVYGKVHVSYGAVKVEDEAAGVTTTTQDNIVLASHASRLGVKGAVPISDSLKGTFGLEWQIDTGIDGTAAAPFSARNQFAGLKGGFGEARFGRHDTPTKMAQGKFDEFNDTYADFASIVRGDQRLANTITYLSPDWSGFSFAAQVAPGEGDGTVGGGGDGPADIMSAAAQFKAAGFFGSLGYDSYDSDSTYAYESLMRAILTWGNKMFQVGGMYEDAKDNTDVAGGGDKTSTGVSGHVTFADVHTIKAQIIMGTTELTAGDTDEAQVSFGYDFKLGKASTVYALVNGYATEDAAGDEDTRAQTVIGFIQDF